MAKHKWIEARSLNDDQQKQLKDLVPKLDELTFKKLISRLETAITYQTHFQSVMGLSPGELRGELESITNSLRKAVRLFERDSMDSLTGALEIDYRILKDPEFATPEFTSEHGFVSSLKCSLEVLDNYQKETLGKEKPKKGRPENMANTYIIREIAEFFKQNIETYKVSANTNSAFYKIVLFVLADLLEQNIRDPEKQIKSFLNKLPHLNS